MKQLLIKGMVFLYVAAGIVCTAKAQDVTIKIHLSGVYDSKISVLPLMGENALKPMLVKEGVKNGETAIMTVPANRLPGEFILRFDYREKESSTPYPAEKQVIVNKQNLELWIKPKSSANPDSTYFQKDEKENRIIAEFSVQNIKKKEQLAMLQNFLMSYDQPGSAFYTMGVEEYEKRRKQYNDWLSVQTDQYKELFISAAFPLQRVQPITWKGTEQERLYSLVDHYFDGMNFKDPLLVKTAMIKDWMNKYVNVYGTMSTTVALRDSLFTLAGKNAIEKARTGHPLVYGWMVDYFYNGYEGFNIASGIKMLEPYLQDPRCLTTKRLEIEKRLQGIESIRPGTIAPDFATTDGGKPVQFHQYKTSSPYKLVLFWSADCQHCKELVEKLYPWYQSIGGKKLMDVFAISLDFTDVEIKAWEDAKGKLGGWKHSMAKGGINSPEANAYYVLATPVMILVDSKTNKIVALPETIDQLQDATKIK